MGNFDWNVFIDNLWERENAQGKRGVEGKGGYRNGKYYPYTTPNGNTDIGPGFDLKYQTPEFRERAKKGFTKQELDRIVQERLKKEIPHFNDRITKEGGNASRIPDNIYAGLLDMHWQLGDGLYDFNKFWKAVANNDYMGMRKESVVTYKDSEGKKHVDTGRRDFRNKNYFTPQTVTPLTPPIIEHPDALRVATPYPTQAQNTVIVPTMVPDEDSYINAHPQTVSEDRANRVRGTFDAINNYNRLMDAIRTQNNPTPQYVPENAPYIVSSYSEGGTINQHKLWDDLSMTEKAEMMKVAVRNGITNLSEIKQRYNEFAEGGHTIHIKPENRGKFTALKEKTGHSATWFKEHGTPAEKRMATFELNARHWKHAEGGNLFDGESQLTQQMVRHKPYYDRDGSLHYNIDLPETVIIPDSQLSPAERNYRERMRQRNLPDYAEQKDREQTNVFLQQAQKDWENSAEKKALDYAQSITTGAGIGADIVSRLPVYSSLKGARVLSEAKTPMDYIEGGLWLAPITSATYQGVKPYAKRAATEAAIAWDLRNPEISNVFSELYPVTKKAEINTSTNKPVFIRWGNDERFAVQPSAEVYNDIVNQLKDARSYRTSSGYKELVNRFTKESRDKGIDFSESLFDGNNKSLSKLTVSNRETGHLGEYYPSTNSIDLDLAQIGDMPVPFHEGIHWQRVGFPADKIGPKFEKWWEARKAKAPNEMQLFEEFRNSPEYTRYYQRKAADKAIQDKVDEALYSFADETLRNKGELQAYGLEAGKAIGIQPFSEYPGMIDALDAIEKARKYSPQLRDIKSGGEENVRRFWDILTGNYVPVTLPIALGSYKYTSKNK